MPSYKTSFTASFVLGVLPLVIASGAGAASRVSLGTAVFGGMLVEPFTTFVVPTIYCGYLENKHQALPGWPVVRLSENGLTQRPFEQVGIVLVRFLTFYRFCSFQGSSHRVSMHPCKSAP